MQDHKKVLQNENDNLRSRIGQMEQDREYDYNERSQKGSALMQNYGVDMEGLAQKSYLSSEIMWIEFSMEFRIKYQTFTKSKSFKNANEIFLNFNLF